MNNLKSIITTTWVLVVLALIIGGGTVFFILKSGPSVLGASDVLAQVKQEADCSCGCGYTLASCQTFDPSCSVRPGIVSRAEELAKQGKTKEEILTILSGKEIVQGSGGAASLETDDDPSFGPQDARVVIVEFSDFQCPYCAKAKPTVSQIKETYPNDVRFVYRDYPLSFHQNAQKAAEASECADEQGKFWQYHDLLFDKQGEWSSGGVSKFKDYARDLGLNTKDFDQCLDSGQMAEEVKQDFADGQSAGVNGTPAFFVNGEMISGAQPFSVFQEKIEKFLK